MSGSHSPFGMPIPDPVGHGGQQSLQLVCSNGKQPGASYDLAPQMVTFGRNDSQSGTSVTYDLTSQEEGEIRMWVSRNHAQCALLQSGWHIADLGSRNGTFVNDHPVEPGKPHPLKVGDRVRFGQLAFTVEIAS